MNNQNPNQNPNYNQFASLEPQQNNQDISKIQSQNQNLLSSNLYKVSLGRTIYIYEKQQEILQKLNFYIIINNKIYSPTYLDSFKSDVVQDEETKQLVFEKLAQYISQNYLKFQKVYGNRYVNPMNQDVKVKNTLIQWESIQIQLKNFRGNNYFSFDASPFVFSKKSVNEIILLLKKNKWEVEDIKSFFRGKKIMIYDYFVRKSVHIIEDLDFQKGPVSKMNQEMTFQEYYEKKHKVVLEDEFQPLIKVRNQLKNVEFNNSLENKNEDYIYLVPEFCRLIVDDNNFSRFNCLEPYGFVPFKADQLVNDIKLAQKVLINNKQFEKFCQIWGFEMENLPTKFDFCWLDAGKFVLKDKVETNANEIANSFNSDQFLQKYQFCFGRGLLDLDGCFDNWAIVQCQEDMDNVDKFTNQIMEISEINQYQIQRPSAIMYEALVQEKWLEWFESQLEVLKNYKLVLFVLRPEIDNPKIYKSIKESLTCQNQVPSQIFKSDTLGEFDYNNNLNVLALKAIVMMSSKLGKAPWIMKQLPFSESPTTVMGINVQHQRQNKRIIVTISKSNNRYFSRFSSLFEIFSYEKYEEINGKLTQIVQKLVGDSIRHFQTLQKFTLKNVIIYRDGAFLENVQNEIQKVREILISDFKSQLQQNQNDFYNLSYVTSESIKKEFRFFQHQDYFNDNANHILNIGQGAQISDNQANRCFITCKNEGHGASRVNRVVVEYSDLGNQNQDICQNLIKLYYSLFYSNFGLSNQSNAPAPLIYAYKYAKFLENLLPLEGNKGLDQKVIENLNSLSNKGSLFYL